jgi:hypothetical protein
VFFDIMYERMPMFCFSCGLIGHSSLVCHNPAVRDKEGKLPWHGEKLCVPDIRKKDWSSEQFSKSSWSGTDKNSASRSASQDDGKQKGAGGSGEATSSGNKSTRSRKMPSTGKNGAPGKETTELQQDSTRVAGQKRKQPKVYRAKIATVVSGEPLAHSVNTAIVPVGQVGVFIPETGTVNQCEVQDDSHKKQKIDPSRSADPAAAAGQPRHPQ